MNFVMSGRGIIHLEIYLAVLIQDKQMANLVPVQDKITLFLCVTCPVSGQPFRRLKCFACPVAGHIYYI